MSDPDPPNKISSQIGDASNILLLVPSLDGRDDEACVDLQTLTSLDKENALFVTISQTADDRMAVWQSQVHDHLPDKIGLITVGVLTRSGTGGPADDTTPQQALTIENVPDPNDLATLRSVIQRYLSVWDDDEALTTLCFHSLTALMQHTTQPELTQFLETLTEKVQEANAVAHYHCDPTAHSQATVDAFKQVVDIVVQPAETNERWTITDPAEHD